MAIERKTAFFGNYTPAIKNRLELQELQALEREVASYRKTISVAFPSATVEEREVFDEYRWLVDRKALTKDGAVIIKNFTRGVHGANGHLVQPLDCDPILYEQCIEDLMQLRRYQQAIPLRGQ